MLNSMKQLGRTAYRRSGGLLGFDVVERSFYSPLPDVQRLPSGMWPGPRPTPGVNFRIEQAARLLSGPLRGYVTEFDPPDRPNAHGSFHLDNGTYGSVDAETLYALLRHAKPARVIELGSGASSHVIAAAKARNAAEDHPFSHTIYDPFPFEANPLGPVQVDLHRTRTEDLAPSAFAALASGDVLFVDTTHTVKTGGDVTHLILEVLPALAMGVLVHFHDIFLPYEYPRDWVVGERRAWAEQYLLQAFLAFNDGYEVLLPNYALTQQAAETVGDVIPSFRPGVRPGSFWLRRTG